METVSEITQIGKISVFTDDREAANTSECSRLGGQRAGGDTGKTDVETADGQELHSCWGIRSQHSVR